LLKKKTDQLCFQILFRVFLNNLFRVLQTTN
jgi:hypothetical protein